MTVVKYYFMMKLFLNEKIELYKNDLKYNNLKNNYKVILKKKIKNIF